MTALLELTDNRRLERAGLLQTRMAVLCIDIGAWARFEPAIFRELQSVCAACVSRKTCADDLAQHDDEPTWPDWRDYCPNAAKLDMLVALQFY